MITLKHRLQGPVRRVSCSVGPEGGPRTSVKSSNDASVLDEALKERHRKSRAMEGKRM